MEGTPRKYGLYPGMREQDTHNRNVVMRNGTRAFTRNGGRGAPPVPLAMLRRKRPPIVLTITLERGNASTHPKRRGRGDGGLLEHSQALSPRRNRLSMEGREKTPRKGQFSTGDFFPPSWSSDVGPRVISMDGRSSSIFPESPDSSKDTRTLRSRRSLNHDCVDAKRYYPLPFLSESSSCFSASSDGDDEEEEEEEEEKEYLGNGERVCDDFERFLIEAECGDMAERWILWKGKTILGSYFATFHEMRTPARL